jgi:hypothetical protein
MTTILPPTPLFAAAPVTELSAEGTAEEASAMPEEETAVAAVASNP